jgi:hypothetical protein
MADTNDFSVGSILSEAWGITTSKYWKLVKFYLVMVVISFGMGMLQGMASESEVMSLVFGLISLAVNLMVSLGLIRVVMAIVRGQEPELADMFVTDSKLIISYIAAMILMGLGIGFGLILLVIPGIYLALLWSQVQYALVDHNLGPLAALAKSKELTSGHLGQILVFYVLALLINLGGLLLLGLGLLITVPWTTVAMYILYDRLQGKKVTSPATVSATEPEQSNNQATEPEQTVL